MNKLKKFIIIPLLFALTSCNPRISTTIQHNYSPLDYREEVVLIASNQPDPKHAEILGQVKISDTGFSTRCGYETVIDKAQLEARKAGGNAIKIIKHKPPSAFGSHCHRITANILKIENIAEYKAIQKDEVLSDADYAIIHVYRYKGIGALVSYDLFLGKDVLCRVRNNYKTTVFVKKDGLNTLWAKTEVKEEIPVKIEFGKSYYLRCGIKQGAFSGRPKLELVENKTGKPEFESFNAKFK